MEYLIRRARPDEATRIAAIEDAAGARFSDLDVIDESRDMSFPHDALEWLLGLGQVWVACLGDEPVGMVIASELGGIGVYIEEMDVLPAHGRRGLGARLLATVVDWAGERTVWLSTFRDVPWNGPFYRKQGFVEIAAADETEEMRAIRAAEAAHGLRIEARCFMRRARG